MIAALFVEKGGVYYGLPDVDPWDIERDARLYVGPWPVVAHPPCERWGSYWFGGPLLHKQGKRKELGSDDGCFIAALNAVHAYGGVIEHPGYSRAWKAFELGAPPRAGGWVPAERAPGWTCAVEQGHYGHRAPKLTWLYFYRLGGGGPPSDLNWGRSGATARVSGPHRDGRKKDGGHYHRRMPDKERKATPIPFRDVLLDIARSCGQPRSAAVHGEGGK